MDRYSNPWVVATCKNDEYTRTHVEKWFENLPRRVKPDFFARLRSKKDGDFLSAFHELLFHQYCLEENWKVTKDKLINNTTPDLYIDDKKGNKFYIEVLVLQKSNEDKKKDELFNKLLRSLDKIETQYLLSVHLKGNVTDSTNIPKVVETISNWLSPLTVEEKADLEINDFGFSGEITARPRNDIPMTGNMFSWSPPGGSFSFPTERIKNELRKKIRKYNFLKDMGIPLIIAVCSDDRPLISHESLDWTLYGRMVVTWEINNPKSETKISRDNSGFATPNPGLMWETRNKGMSAVIFCSRHWEEKRVLYDMRVYHNPWAINKLSDELFKKMPQFAEVKIDPKFITLKWINDNKQKIVFS
ncbi:MAG: hypothetical protein M1324_01230 [Patescibacteria group bacterium]|nr:hypothetical protein [Patescibacteria group bacterium]